MNSCCLDGVVGFDEGVAEYFFELVFVEDVGGEDNDGLEDGSAVAEDLYGSSEARAWVGVPLDGVPVDHEGFISLVACLVAWEKCSLDDGGLGVVDEADELGVEDSVSGVGSHVAGVGKHGCDDLSVIVIRIFFIVTVIFITFGGTLLTPVRAETVFLAFI